MKYPNLVKCFVKGDSRQSDIQQLQQGSENSLTLIRKGECGKRMGGGNTKRVVAEKVQEKLTMKIFYCGDSVWTAVRKSSHGEEGRFPEMC